MSSRRPGLLVAATATAAIALTACSSSTSGTGSTAGSGGASAAGPSAGAASSSSAPVNSAESLAALLQQGLASTTSAHLALQVTSGGQSITGSGDETLSDGKLTALDLSETVPGAGSLQIIQTGGKTYVKLPAAQNTSGKPYELVSASSSNPTIKALAASLDSTQSSASAGSAGVLASAASSVKPVGSVTVGGVSTTHYAVVVDTTKLPDTYPGKSALVGAGVTSLPVELYVDGSGRPVQVTENLTASGQSVSTKITLTDYNKPVTITAPPADQVSTD